MYMYLHFHAFLTTVQSIFENLRALFSTVYPVDVNPIEVNPIEAYLMGKGSVEVSGLISMDRTLLYTSSLMLMVWLVCVELEMKNA
jgi:hypothetical protein